MLRISFFPLYQKLFVNKYLIEFLPNCELLNFKKQAIITIKKLLVEKNKL